MCDDLNWPEEEFRVGFTLHNFVILLLACMIKITQRCHILLFALQKILETCKEKPTDIATASRNKYKNRNKDVLPCKSMH